MFQTATSVLDWIGIVAFSVTGAIVAARKEMDVVGFMVLGTATGIGGGTLRDMLLGVPVFWVSQPSYLVTCAVASIIAFFATHLPESRYRILLWLDAVGLAVFAITGTEKAMLAGTNFTTAVTMGVITATFGGIFRDLLGGGSPVILSREIYASAALCGAVTFVGLTAVGTLREAALVIGFAVGLLIRAAALRYGWSLPRYQLRS